MGFAVLFNEDGDISTGLLTCHPPTCLVDEEEVFLDVLSEDVLDLAAEDGLLAMLP